ncbi:MAG TPA: protein translocase subunit SecF [Caldilineaceae bacterium]|nr:protein translocase subunit SecF [Caldilineaceae bacterium]
MFDIVGRRGLWYIITAILTAPAILFMAWSFFTYGTILPLNIDFRGGTMWEMRFNQPVAPAEVRQVFVEAGYSGVTVFTVEDDQTVQAKLETLEPEEKESLVGALTERFGEFEERQYRSIGPSIGAEVSRAALGAVVVASVGILLYIAWAFRTVSHPFRYGTCAVIALVHDVLVTITFIGIMHWVAGWEVDALFLTAILTVIGFSVNDTIVVFDRIRENLKRHRGEDFATVTNRSLWETMQRSLGTQITVNLVLVAILVFGGGSLRQFMATMLAGMLSGTYSSIFNAAPLLVAWEERSWLGARRKKNGALADRGTAVAA